MTSVWVYRLPIACRGCTLLNQIEGEVACTKTLLTFCCVREQSRSNSVKAHPFVFSILFNFFSVHHRMIFFSQADKKSVNPKYLWRDQRNKNILSREPRAQIKCKVEPRTSFRLIWRIINAYYQYRINPWEKGRGAQASFLPRPTLSHGVSLQTKGDSPQDVCTMGHTNHNSRTRSSVRTTPFLEMILVTLISLS